MRIAGLGGYLAISTSARATARAAQQSAATARSRAADNEALQGLGRFLQDFRGRFEEARRVVGASSHSVHPGRFRLAATATRALSATATATTLRSSSPIAGAAASHSPAAPEWTRAARSEPTIGGTYDGSNGDQTLTVEVTTGGTVGQDALALAVLDAEGTQLESLAVAADYVAGDDIALANGLTMRLGAGLVEAGSAFTIDVAHSVTEPSSSFSPAEPTWTVEARPQVTLGGAYDGSNGTQRLTLGVAGGGTVGSDDLVIDVLDAEGSTLGQLEVAAAYTPGDALTLANGVTVALGAGYLATGDTFALDVTVTPGAPQRTFTPGSPAWGAGSTAAATIGGAYDGSNGTQALTYRVTGAGEVGVEALTLQVLDAEGSLLEQVDIAADYVAGTALTLANGLTLSLGSGLLEADDSFTVDVAEVAGASTYDYAAAAADWITAARPGATIAGAYDGAHGSGQLTLRVSGAGVVGADALLVDLLDSEGTVLSQLSVAAGYTPGDAIDLGNGLSLALGAGALGLGDEFVLDVAYDAGGTQASATADTSGWAAGAAPVATVGGTYDGSNGTQALTLRVAQGGEVGVDALLVDVLDAEGTLLEQLSVAADYEAGAALALANGLTLSLATGSLGAGDEFTVDVTAASEVDTAAAFDSAPSWLGQATISDGAFTLNGVQVDVYASDSLDGVIARINGADAGVTATWDAANGRVVLTQATTGSAAEIAVADDTSGFLAAVGLEGATAAAGGDGDFASALSQVDALAGLASGTFQVNGRDIDVDVDADSLDDLVIRLRDAGLTLEYDDAADRFRLRGRGALSLDDGDTGFFAALGLAAGEYPDARAAEGFADPARVAGQLRGIVAEWKPVVPDDAGGSAALQAARLNTSLRAAIERHFAAAGLAAAGDTLRTDFGLSFRFRPDGALELGLDEQQLALAMRADSQRIQDFLAGPDGRGGLFAALENTLQASAVAVGGVLSVRGLSALDVYA